MKKKLTAIILSCVLAASMLTACSDEEETSGSTVNTEDVKVQKVEDETGNMEKSAATEGLSQSELNELLNDEEFADFQEKYSTALEGYNFVVDAYNAGKITPSKEHEEYLDDCYEFLSLLGEVEQKDLTYGDAIEFAEDLNAMLEYFNHMVN
ncbi:MAG: hypothetical protein ACI4E5_08905 [Suilimivivens sp.]